MTDDFNDSRLKSTTACAVLAQNSERSRKWSSANPILRWTHSRRGRHRLDAAIARRHRRHRSTRNAQRAKGVMRASVMKRAVYGTHHSISQAHLPRYLNEWDYNRKTTDAEGAAIAVNGAEGQAVTISTAA
jgi:hypothetical protein